MVFGGSTIWISIIKTRPAEDFFRQLVHRAGNPFEKHLVVGGDVGVQSGADLSGKSVEPCRAVLSILTSVLHLYLSFPFRHQILSISSISSISSTMNNIQCNINIYIYISNYGCQNRRSWLENVQSSR